MKFGENFNKSIQKLPKNLIKLSLDVHFNKSINNLYSFEHLTDLSLNYYLYNSDKLIDLPQNLINLKVNILLARKINYINLLNLLNLTIYKLLDDDDDDDDLHFLEYIPKNVEIHYNFIR